MLNASLSFVNFYSLISYVDLLSFLAFNSCQVLETSAPPMGHAPANFLELRRIYYSLGNHYLEASVVTYVAISTARLPIDVRMAGYFSYSGDHA